MAERIIAFNLVATQILNEPINIIPGEARQLG